MSWQLFEGDCFDYLPLVEDQSVDMVLCDLPYGLTACKWDTPLPLDKLWKEYERVIKDNGAIVLTGSQPFTSHLVMSNPKLFRSSWVWEKDQASNFLMANRYPLKKHEDILVFSKTPPIYNPIMWDCGKLPNPNGKSLKEGRVGRSIYNDHIKMGNKNQTTMRYPSSIIKFNTLKPNQKEKAPHPTQKPVALFEYLIRTYTNPGDLVLDNCAGSGTTGVACENTNRNSILMEKEPEYCQIIRNRLDELNIQTKLPVEA